MKAITIIAMFAAMATDLHAAQLASAAASSESVPMWAAEESSSAPMVNRKDAHRASSKRRRAAVGDFARFNELFDDAKISIPGEFEISERIALIQLKMKLRNIRCYSITIGDVTLDHVRNSNQDIDILVDVIQLDMRCDLDYDYDYWPFSGDGTARVTTDNNAMSTVLGFASTNFDTEPPNNSDVESCTPNIEITNIEFVGDFLSEIVEIFERFIRNTIETEIEKVACDELSSLGTSFVGDILGLAEDSLAQYQGDIGASVTDPLYLEQITELPTDLMALNLLDTENTIGQWFNQALDELDNLLGATVPDADGPTGTGRDLGVNVLMRDSLLDDDRALVVDVEQLPMDAVLFQGHDRMTETTIALKQVKVFGLDSLTHFNPLARIGQYTLQTEMTWQRLTVEFNVTVDIKPSSLDDSILEEATSPGISENIKIDFGVDNLDVIASLLLIIDQSVLGTMEIGPLLHIDNLLPCLLSVLHSVQLSGLHVNSQTINVPTLSGFVSPGIDRVLSGSAEAVFEMYRGVLQDALPNIFETSVRDFVNREVIDNFLSNEDLSTCPPAADVDGFVDFRDLLLGPEQALTSGGTGTEQYGDLAHTVMDLVRDNLVTTDSNGLLDLNSFLVAPLTQGQSGMVGSLHFPSDLISLTKTTFANKYIRSFVDRFEIGLSNLRLHNLDILKAPVAILEITESPNVLTNALTMGPVEGRALNATVGLSLLLSGDEESPLEMNSDVDISISFDSASIGADLLAKIDASRFLRFPLKDVLNAQCWLATIPAPTLNADGLRVSGSEISLGLSDIALVLSSLGLNVNFVNTTSPGVGIISEILNNYTSSGSSVLLLDRMNAFGNEILESDVVQRILDHSLMDAPQFCPHNLEYNVNAVSSFAGEFEFPALSTLTIDSMFYAAALVAESAFFVYMEGQSLEESEPSDPLSGQASLGASENLLDWTNIGGRAGPFVDSAVSELSRYLGSPESDSGDLGINVMIRDWLLNDTDVLSWVFDDLDFDLPGIEMSLSSVKIEGLDSFSEFDLWQPIAPQTIQNQFRLDKLAVELVVDVVDQETKEYRQGLSIGLSMSDIQANVAIFFAMNQDRLEELELGSFMSTSNILPCLLSAIDRTEITQIDMTLGTLTDPQIEGLLPDSEASINDFTSNMMLAFRAKIADTIPVVVDGVVRSLLNGLLVTYLEGEPCPKDIPPVSTSAFIDFEDFFDEETSSYGDLPPLIMNLVDAELLALDATTGAPRINEVLISPLTKRQSGEEGTIVIAGELFTLFSESIPEVGFDSLEVGAFNASMMGLNTFVAPLDLLVPSTTKDFVIHNTVTLAQGPESLRLAATGVVASIGDPALSFHNELEFSINLGGSEFFAALMAKIDKEAFFDFPLRDVFNTDCWLASVASALLVGDGDVVSEESPGLSLETILLSIPSLDFNVECKNCTSPGLLILPELFSSLKRNGTLQLLEERLVDFGLEVLRSDFLQSHFNRMVLEGTLRCPHHESFESSTAFSNSRVPSFPSVSYSAIESLAFAGTTVLNIAAVVIAESHLTSDEEGKNYPLSGQAEVDAMGDVRLIDFSSLETSIGGWADNAVDQLLDYLTATISDAKGPSGKDLRINNILRSTLLSEDGLLDLKFENVGIVAADTELSLKHVKITGLDTIRSFDVLEAIGPQTLQNELKWESLGLEMVITIMGQDVEQGRILQTKEEIIVTLALADIDVSMVLLLAMDLDLLGSLELGSILEIEKILPCILSTARAAKMTEFRVNVGSIESFSVNGFRSEDVALAVDTTNEFVLSTYGDRILSAMPGFFDVTVKALMNNYLSYYMGAETNLACPVSKFDAATPSSYVDFRDLLLSAAKARLLGGSGLSQYGNLFRTALGFIQDLVLQIDEATGLSKVNDILVAPLTRSQSDQTGTLVFPGDLFSGGTRLQVGGLDATIQLRASDARIDNIDSIGAPMDLLIPVESDGHTVNNTATIGVGDRSLRFGIRFLLSLMGDDNMQLYNDMDISLDLSKATLVLGTMLKIAESRFLQFPMRDVLNLDCWLATIPAPGLDNRGVRPAASEPTAALTELAASVAQLSLNVSCIDCSSPRMTEWTELLSSPAAQDDATEAANMVLDYAKGLLGGNFLQFQIDRTLNDAARRCPHSPTFETDFNVAVYESFEASKSEDDSITFLVLLGGVTLGLIVLLSMVVLSVRWFVRHRHRKWLATVSPAKARSLAHWQDAERKKEAEMDAATRSMSTSPDIPRWVRWSMPIIIIGNIAFFLSGHLSLGATVNIEIAFAGEEIVVENFFEFSMAKSTVDIWNAGGRELAILILIFSGLWPYTKQIMTLVLWFLPPSRVSTSRRGSILLWLDWLAKWSMIDIFVLVISIAAFRVSIGSPDVGFLPRDFYSIDLLVVPLWGLYANLLAQLISQISSHFIIHYHRRIVEAYKSNNTMNTGEEVPNTSNVLREHHFGRPHRGEDDRLEVRSWINTGVWISAFILISLVVVGCSLPSFSLKILGLVGVAVESGQGFEDAITQYSVFTVVNLLMEEARFLDTIGDWIGLLSLSFLLIFSVLVVPVMQCFALLGQWFKRSTNKQRARMAITIEILQAWQYAEVYIIAIFVASWQLGPVSEFMINSYCDSLQDTFAQWVYFGIIKEEDAQCFSVQSSIEEGSFILATGAVILALLNTFVNKAASQYCRDRAEEAKAPINDIEDAEKDSSSIGDEEEGKEKVKPFPVLFTDTFRWLLQREDQNGSCGLVLVDEQNSFCKHTTRTFSENDVQFMNGSMNSDIAAGIDVAAVMADTASDATSHLTSSEELDEMTEGKMTGCE